MRVACIGAREWLADSPEGKMLVEMGRFLATRGHSIHSGNAVGADQAFAIGANSVNPEQVWLYLPWAGYEAGAIRPQNQTFRLSTNPTEAKATALKAREYYNQYRHNNPAAWESLSYGVQCLMRRNVEIISSANRMVAAPRCLPDGTPTGGTAFGIFLAEKIFQIPVSLVRLDIPYSDQGPSWDRCHTCGFKRTFWDCGNPYHALKGYC